MVGGLMLHTGDRHMLGTENTCDGNKIKRTMSDKILQLLYCRHVGR